MQRAFEVADRFQVPVMVLTDQYLLDSVSTVAKEALATLPVTHYVIETKADYKRYVVTKDGVSPRGIPGYGTGLVGVDSDEHDTEAHITESHVVRLEQHGKRLRKLDGLREVALPPTVIGNLKKARTLIVTWGSNLGVVEEALDTLHGSSLAQVHFSQVYPLSPAGKKLFSKTKDIVVIENNAAGQFANLLEQEYGVTVKERILQYDGNPFAVEDVVKKLQALH
jgi:2-oxoglutarate ferredoxin oxidoreductase subunit alpha